MVFSNEDKIFIKNFRESEGYSARKFTKEFPDKNWNRKGLDYLLKKLRETGTVKRKVGIAASDVQHARRRTSMPLKTSSSVRKTNPEHIGQHGRLQEKLVCHRVLSYKLSTKTCR